MSRRRAPEGGLAASLATKQSHKEIVVQAARPPAKDGTEKAFYPMIGTPAFAGLVTAQYLYGMLQLQDSLRRSGLSWEVALLTRESLITRARNKIVSDFLKSTCTHLMFIDADIGFTSRDVKPLLESGFDVVGGSYPLKAIGWRNAVDAVLRAKEAGLTREQEPELAARLPLVTARFATNLSAEGTNGAPFRGAERAGAKFILAQDAPTGFLCIRRAALERFVAHYREQITYVADYEPNVGELHHAVFQCGRDPTAIARGEPAKYLSEDYMFSRMWQMMGGEIWICLDCHLQHVGPHNYEGDFASLFTTTVPAPSAT